MAPIVKVKNIHAPVIIKDRLKNKRKVERCVPLVTYVKARVLRNMLAIERMTYECNWRAARVVLKKLHPKDLMNCWNYKNLQLKKKLQSKGISDKPPTEIEICPTSKKQVDSLKTGKIDSHESAPNPEVSVQPRLEKPEPRHQPTTADVESRQKRAEACQAEDLSIADILRTQTQMCFGISKINDAKNSSGASIKVAGHSVPARPRTTVVTTTTFKASHELKSSENESVKLAEDKQNKFVNTKSSVIGVSQKSRNESKGDHKNLKETSRRKYHKEKKSSDYSSKESSKSDERSQHDEKRKKHKSSRKEEKKKNDSKKVRGSEMNVAVNVDDSFEQTPQKLSSVLNQITNLPAASGNVTSQQTHVTDKTQVLSVSQNTAPGQSCPPVSTNSFALSRSQAWFLKPILKPSSLFKECPAASLTSTVDPGVSGEPTPPLGSSSRSDKQLPNLSAQICVRQDLFPNGSESSQCSQISLSWHSPTYDDASNGSSTRSHEIWPTSEERWLCPLCDHYDSRQGTVNKLQVKAHIVFVHALGILDMRNRDAAKTCTRSDCMANPRTEKNFIMHTAYFHQMLWHALGGFKIPIDLFRPVPLGRPYYQLKYECLRCRSTDSGKRFSCLTGLELHLALVHYADVLVPNVQRLGEMFVCQEIGCDRVFRTRNGQLAHELVNTINSLINQAARLL